MIYGFPTGHGGIGPQDDRGVFDGAPCDCLFCSGRNDPPWTQREATSYKGTETKCDSFPTFALTAFNSLVLASC